MGGRPRGMTGVLLTARNPNSLLQQTQLQQYETEHRTGVIGKMQTLTVKKANAEAEAKLAAQKARAAQAHAKVLQQRAVAAQQAAAQAVANQRSQQQTLETTMSSTRTELNSASSELATLNGQRAKYQAYVRHQRELARQRRLAAQRRRAEQRRIAREKRLAAQRARNRHSSGNGGGSSYSPPMHHSPPAPRSGGWSRAKARQAVRRARSTLGMPYAWAGGGAGGPSYGACVPSAGAPYDCHVYGYDCSGLAMYAWGQGWAHYAATQYTQAGQRPPELRELPPR